MYLRTYLNKANKYSVRARMFSITGSAISTYVVINGRFYILIPHTSHL